MTNVQQDQFREALLAERERIQRALDYLHHENSGSLDDDTGNLAAGADDHMGDVASETFDRELDYSLEGNAEAVLVQIDEALKRIERGTYGICKSCGRPIDPERLEARPWAALDIDCQRRQERG